MQELINKHIVEGFDIDEYEEDGTQIIKWCKGKVTAIRNKKKSWVVWDGESGRNDWKQFLPNKWNKSIDESWKNKYIYKIISLDKN